MNWSVVMIVMYVWRQEASRGFVFLKGTQVTSVKADNGTVLEPLLR